jgi:c-di-GMP-binding flagellar brake protein YcgR
MADLKSVTLSPGLVSTSADEVERVLRALLMRREPLAALLGGGASSQWKLRFVDPARQYIIVEPASDKSAAAALLERERVTFLAEFGGMQIEFTAERPSRQGETSAVRLAFPAVTVSHQRRAHRRAQVSGDFPLRCAIPIGAAAALEAQIMDISEGGIGLLIALLVRSEGITPAPGTVIKGCRIERLEKGPVRVDLEVRHCRPVVLVDRSDAQRWGSQFLDPSDEVKELARLFAKE